MQIRLDPIGIISRGYDSVTGEYLGLFDRQHNLVSAPDDDTPPDTPDVVVTLTGDYAVVSADDNATFQATTPLTVTVAAGVTMTQGFLVRCPPAGVLTLTPGSGVTFNGSTSSLTFSRVLYPNGVLLTPYGSNAWGVTL